MQKKLLYLIFSQLLVILQVMLLCMTILTQQSVWETYVEVFSSQSFLFCNLHFLTLMYFVSSDLRKSVTPPLNVNNITESICSIDH